MRYEDILYFWFYQCSDEQHWAKDHAFDMMIKRRFEPVYQAARSGACAHWRSATRGRSAIRGRLAEIILLDQFPRHMYRDTSAAFASDALALFLAQEAWSGGRLCHLAPKQRVFAMMPFMHSESLAIQEQSVEIFTALGATEQRAFAIRHRDIIARFGRFPHRNAILGRNSTAEELMFLTRPDSRF